MRSDRGKRRLHEGDREEDDGATPPVMNEPDWHGGELGFERAAEALGKATDAV
jgi:hypothetical protein